MTRAYAIVREDISGDATEAHVAQIRRLAIEHHWDLRGVLIAADDAQFSVLFATFGASQIELLLLPDLRHVIGWRDAVEHEQVALRTLDPPKRWDKRIGHVNPTANAADLRNLGPNAGRCDDRDTED